MACGDAPPILDAAEEIFDFVPPSVKAPGTIGFLSGVAAVGDDRHSPFIPDLLAHFCAVVSLVRGNSQRRSGRDENIFDDLTVMDLSAGHGEAEWPTFAIDCGVDFRGSAASADADRLIFLPPFAPLAAR